MADSDTGDLVKEVLVCDFRFLYLLSSLFISLIAFLVVGKGVQTICGNFVAVYVGIKTKCMKDGDL